MSQRKVSAQQHREICAIYKAGLTQTALSKQFGVSKARIQQILKASGVNSDEGGRAEIKRQAQAQKDREHVNKFGCTKSQLDGVRQATRSGSHDPFNLFKSQQRHAMRRGVKWKLNFWDWWNIWQESGHWEQRGRGVGSYCMCRNGDEGPYAKGNVYIGTAVHNSVLGRTLSLERNTNKTFMYRLIHCAGGPSLVASKLGVSKNYISQSMLRNEMPKCGRTNGRLEVIVSMTAGAYSKEAVEREIAKGGLHG